MREPLSEGASAAEAARQSRARETVPAVVHSQVEAEEAILEVRDFCLWYGAKQALFDIRLRVPAAR